MTDDDRFDELLQEAARDYNSAPGTPRAEMWAAIAAARGKAQAEIAPEAHAGAPVAVRVVPLYSRHRRVLGWVAGLAATLLVGIVIGRQMTLASAPDARIATSAASPAAASSSADDPGKLGTGPAFPAGGGPKLAAAETGSAGSAAPNGDRHAARETRAAFSGLAVADDATRGGAGSAARGAAREAALPYRVAAMQHLLTTEALLVSLRSDVRAGRRDTTIAGWAGELLGTTRMLMDSPAGRDPQLKQLLEDLELVLAQISRLPGARGEAADLGLIDDAVRHRQIMTRLRALSPDT